MVEHAVASWVGPMPLVLTGGGIDGCRAVVGGVVMAGGEPCDVTAVADQQAGHHGTDAVDVNQRRAARLDRFTQPLLRGGEFFLEAPYLGEELVGDTFPFRLRHGDRPDALQQPGGPVGHHFCAHTARNQRCQGGVEPTRGLGFQ